MLVIVGGHSRNIGKTAVAAGIIRALPEARWTAIKITQYGHGVCSNEGETCDCAPADRSHPYLLTEEHEASRTDSGRFLAAGAARSFWLRTAVGELGHAAPVLKRLIAESPNTILESNSALHFFRPDLYLSVLDPTVADVKDSARLFLDRADALVVVGSGAAVEFDAGSPWPEIPRRWLQERPRFPARRDAWVSPELAAFVRASLSLPSGTSS